MIKNPKNVSSKEVAKEAGVSQATVSYVLNNVPGIKIKPETREAVIRAASKLNYHPNLIAKSMKTKKSMSIGVVTEVDLSNHLFISILEGIKKVLNTKNYSITLCDNKPLEHENYEYIDYFESNRIDGIIFVLADLKDVQISYLVDNNVPFFIIHSNPKSDSPHLLRTEMGSALSDMVGCLVDKGITSIGYFGTGIGTEDRRFKGYINALEQYKIPVLEKNFIEYTGNEKDVRKCLDEYISKSGNFPRAIICETVNSGLLTLKYTAEQGIKVPYDLSVAAIGASRYSGFSYPSLSAIESPLYDMGVKGTRMLFDIMEGNNQNNVVVLKWFFVNRDSC